MVVYWSMFVLKGKYCFDLLVFFNFYMLDVCYIMLLFINSKLGECVVVVFDL